MATARKIVALLMTVLLAWTSIAAGVFASQPALARDHGGFAVSGHSIGPQQHGAHHDGASGGHARAALLPVGVAIELAQVPQRSDRACVADCLDQIAAKLMPAVRAAPAPADQDGKVILWPRTSEHALRAAAFMVTPPATGPPRQPPETATGIARLVHANARLRI